MREIVYVCYLDNEDDCGNDEKTDLISPCYFNFICSVSKVQNKYSSINKLQYKVSYIHTLM